MSVIRNGALAAGAALAMGLPGVAQAADSARAQFTMDHRQSSIGGATTGSADAFRLVNTSTAGQQVVRAEIDLVGGPTLFPDIVFDPPDSTPAGDTAGTGFDISPLTSGGVDADAEFLDPFEDGYGRLALDVTGLGPGETLSFRVDVDPTSIRGAVGVAPAGAISGAELHGAVVTVTFDDGTLRRNDLSITPGSLTGSGAALVPGLPPEPGLGRAGGAPSPAVVTAFEQALVVTGPPGAQGTIVFGEGHLNLTNVPGGGFDVEPYEANALAALESYPFTIGAACTATVGVNLSDSGSAAVTGINVITAYLRSGSVRGPVSRQVVLRLSGSAPTGAPAVADPSVFCPPGPGPGPDPGPGPGPAPGGGTEGTGTTGTPVPPAATTGGTSATAAPVATRRAPDEIAAAPQCAPARALPARRRTAANAAAVARTARLALARTVAVERRLAGGLRGRDLCAGALTARVLAPDVVTAVGDTVTGPAAAPRRVRVTVPRTAAGTVGAAQARLLAAVAGSRSAALSSRLAGRLTGADLAPGAVTADRLAPGLVVTSEGAGGTARAARVTSPRRTPATLAAAARQADAALRRSDLLVRRIESGLTGDAFAAGTIGARELAG